MSLDRQIVRLMAAMILAIIAYVVPSAVQAHEGHAHHGHHRAATQRTVVPSTAKAALPAPAKPAVRAEAPIRSKLAIARPVAEGVRFEPTGDDCCPAGCRTRCCGTMACCAAGVLPGPSVPSPSVFRATTLIPRDVAGRSETDPEALPKPPRTRA